MSTIKKEKNLKAIILAAGMGSRMKALTFNTPKCLLEVNRYTILEMMLSHIRDCGIHEIVIILGYLPNKITDFLDERFLDLEIKFIINERYQETNTGYSLMLARDFVKDSPFIKFDADVVFDKGILENLISCKHQTCLCIDKNINLNDEEIKVIVEGNNRVVKASKTVNPKDAIGESIGIEKISAETAQQLFYELALMMIDEDHLQDYYEAAYERLILKDTPFYALDITEFNWIEIDTREDFMAAEAMFSANGSH